MEGCKDHIVSFLCHPLVHVIGWFTGLGWACASNTDTCLSVFVTLLIFNHQPISLYSLTSSCLEKWAPSYGSTCIFRTPDVIYWSFFYPWKIQFYTKQSLLHNKTTGNREHILFYLLLLLWTLSDWKLNIRSIYPHPKRTGARSIFYLNSLVEKGWEAF